MEKTLIIAEAGVNHNGIEKLAFDLVDVAHQAGVDVIKFQTFKAQSLVTENAELADYQKDNLDSRVTQLSMLKKLELPYDSFRKLVTYCKDKNIHFLSTAFDSESLHFLVNDLELTMLKIPSGEITNAPFLLEHAKTGCDLILSTGMCSLSEVEKALGVLAFGFLNNDSVEPSIDKFQEAYCSIDGQKKLKEKVKILHCTTEYPAPLNEINIRAMQTLNHAFSLPVGYSDHSEGIVVPIAAVAREAVIIEKHFTLDKNMEGPDHKASIEPDELRAMVSAIRTVEVALGSKIKYPTASEAKNKVVARKSLVAARYIEIGAKITNSDVVAKRPGGGMSPYLYWSVIGKKASKKYVPGEQIFE